MAPRPILLDVTRLVRRAHRRAPTGIDRVALAYAEHLLARDDVALTPVVVVGGRLAPISRGRLRALLARARADDGAPSADGARLAMALGGSSGFGLRPARPASALDVAGAGVSQARRLAAGLSPFAPPAGALYLNVAHFGLESPDLLGGLVARGVTSVAMVHDLIPITHPEYCAPPARERHETRMRTVLAHARTIIANSRHTAAEVERFARERGLGTPDVCVAPLGVEAAFRASPSPIASKRPYFVAVGTIEPRKNFALLLTLWRRLAERMGEAAPLLVLVGRRGWECEQVVDHLERSPPIRSHVHEVSDLRDGELASLLAGARALLAPSFTEGFHLPVAEARALGLPVIASDIPVHRELAADAVLIDPLDGPAWLAEIERRVGVAASRDPVAVTDWRGHFDIVSEALGLSPGPARSRPLAHV